jgi:hypothetical protein
VEAPRQKAFFVKKQEKEVGEVIEKLKKQSKVSKEKELILQEKQELLQRERTKTRSLKQRVEEQERRER